MKFHHLRFSKTSKFELIYRISLKNKISKVVMNNQQIEGSIIGIEIDKGITFTRHNTVNL